MFENNYPAHFYYDCEKQYITPKNVKDWKACPKCNLKPKVWTFDNGEFTACGCFENRYKHFSIEADETIAECVRRTGGFTEYDDNALMKKWNTYCDSYVSNQKQSLELPENIKQFMKG